VMSGATVAATDGMVAITGTGGGHGSNRLPEGAGTGFENHGVYLLNDTITSNQTITLIGTGGDGSNPFASAAQMGVVIYGTVVHATGTTAASGITVTGHGGGSSDAAYGMGVVINNGNN